MYDRTERIKYSTGVLICLSRKTVMFRSGVLVQRNCAYPLGSFFKQCFNVPHRFRFEQNISTDCTNLRRHMVNYNDMSMMTNGVDNLLFFIFSGAILDTALYFCFLRSVGVTHLGGFGS